MPRKTRVLLTPLMIRRMVALVAARAHRKSVHIRELAAEIGISESAFSHGFKEATGEAPHARITRLRLERAQKLLAETHLPIAAIAEQVGYRTQSHLAIAFRVALGTTPSAWRKQSKRVVVRPRGESKASAAAR